MTALSSNATGVDPIEICLESRLIWRGASVYPRAVHLRLLLSGACVLDVPVLDASGEPFHAASASFSVDRTPSGFRFTGGGSVFPEWPRNGNGALFYAAGGVVCLPYETETGALAVAVAPYPAALAAMTFDPAPRALAGVHFENPASALEALFTRIPLSPASAWQPPANALPGFKAAFEAAVELLRLPACERWAVRGEPEHFVMVGGRTAEGWRVAIVMVAKGKPAVITLRCEDVVRALPQRVPTRALTLIFSGDGFTAERIEEAGWDARLRLPLADNGGAVIELIAHSA